MDRLFSCKKEKKRREKRHRVRWKRSLLSFLFIVRRKRVSHGRFKANDVPELLPTVFRLLFLHYAKLFHARSWRAVTLLSAEEGDEGRENYVTIIDLLVPIVRGNSCIFLLATSIPPILFFTKSFLYPIVITSYCLIFTFFIGNPKRYVVSKITNITEFNTNIYYERRLRG